MEFRTINTDIEEMFNDYITKWYQSGETVVPWSTDVNIHGGFSNMLKMHEEAINHPNSDFVKAKTFVLIDDFEIKGAVNIRYDLNDFLRNKGGHVGYGVSPSQRGKGYATQLLAFAIKELRQDSVKEVLVTCSENNIASANVILNNGGIEDEPFISEEQEITRRFWIHLV
nr:GNAT family N-acetyltransferase [Mammaliicoccus sp. Marseille-Q6498]